MSRALQLAVLSDIHYFSAAEQTRGADYEIAQIVNPLARALLKAYRHHIWLRHPLDHNRALDRFIESAGRVDGVIANGDYSCDSAFVGVSDDAAFRSAAECLDKLRARFGTGLRATIGDHELGKFSLIGARGGMRLASYHRTRRELALEAFWQFEFGRYVVMGVASSLAALPVLEPETLTEERPEWNRLRAEHLADIGRAFSALKPEQRVLLFCHDPTALPFLGREPAVREKLSQIEGTVIGHLHSNLILWKSRLLAGMPTVGFLGPSIRRITTGLRDARLWREFRPRLCPALSGIELLKDGGFFTVQLDADVQHPAQFQWHPLKR